MSEPRYPYIHVDVTPEEAEEVGALLFELGAEGVEERDAGTLAKADAPGKVTLVAAFASRADAEEAIGNLPEPLTGRYEEIVGDAWRDAWKEHYRPFTIAKVDGGPAIVIRPPWEPYAAKDGERLRDEHAGRLEGATVIDVGCGSGILALVALELGAARAIAIDLDPEAVDVTRENAARNGRTHAVDASTAEVGALAVTAPVVIANIEAKVLIPLADALAAKLAPGGLLLLSGILVPQKDDVRAAYPDLAVAGEATMGEWTLLALERRG